jgi:hypothetical protein
MAAPREYSGKGFILGGVTDETPDWLGSYDAGVQGAQQQTTTRLNQRETRQRMGQNAAEEARRAQIFANQQADRNTLIDETGKATGASDVPFNATPGPGLMPLQDIPAPQAPSPGLMTEPTSNQPTALTRDQFLQMLPEWAGYESEAGLPPGFLERTAMLESSNGTNFREGSQYIGVFQIGAGVAKDFDVTPEQLKDPRVNAQVAAKLAKRNASVLRVYLGRDPQPWELYLAHQQGAAGAAHLLSNPDMNVVDALTKAYSGGNPEQIRTRVMEIITANGGNPQMTAGQFAQVWASKYGGGVGVGSDPGVKDVPVIPGAQSQASRPGRMDSGTARLPNMPNVSSGVPVEPVTGGGKRDIPAGLMMDAPAAPTAPGQVSINANGVPVTGAPAAPQQAGLQTASEYVPPNVTNDEAMPRVSQEDYAGLDMPGRGSIADQIMRSPAGQPAALPESGMYLIEPARITNERRLLAAKRGLLQRQLETAKRLRDVATITDLQNKDFEIVAADNLLQAMEVIAGMQQGDDEQFAQTLSGLTQGRQRLQPRSDGKFNVYWDGKLQSEGVDRNQIIASLRMQYDQQYQALVAQRVASAQEREGKVLDSQLKQSEEITKQQAIMYKDVAIEQLKRSYPADASVNFDAATGRLVVVPDQGRGQPEMWEIAPVMGTNGQPVEDGAGNQKMELRRVNTAGSSVPVQ